MNIDKLFDAKLSFIAREQSNALAEDWQDMDIYDVADAFIALKECYCEAISKLDDFDNDTDWNIKCFNVIR